MSTKQKPYECSPPLMCRCIMNNTTSKAASFIMEGDEIKIQSRIIKTVSVLSDGESIYLAHTEGENPIFEQGETYVLKKHTVSMKYETKCIFLGPSSKKYLAPPMELSEDIKQKAHQALTKPSTPMTGKEKDLTSRGGYITLKGKVEKLQVARMITVKEGRVPVLDVSLRCEEILLEITLWRDVALTELHLEDEVEFSHLRVVVRQNGHFKFNSSSFTCVKVSDPFKEEEVEIIAVTPEEDGLHLLTSDYEDYVLPKELYGGTCSDFLKRLPMEIKIVHSKGKIIQMHNPEM
nr:uncharacterized protein LOC129452408 [Misgurnus anguillicaudatus]XP_055072221.1 uncharacterized protein LOC129452408 [Misgurnus anguillicaudatus]XP_055072222.1 uncharacterized protein LOC129452408 [Misgurnus anguillicaudatus]